MGTLCHRCHGNTASRCHGNAASPSPCSGVRGAEPDMGTRGRSAAVAMVTPHPVAMVTPRPHPLVAVSEVLVRSGTRALRDNVADLRAQVAANHKGATLLRELVATYGLSGVTAYMEHIRTNAERSVRALLRGAAQRWGAVLEAEDRMDDGTPICLRVTVDPEEVSGEGGPLRPMAPHRAP
ncbi:5-oxoprolinase [Phasianus colchicus]|uniref:5-oxoprolinase n=1 Tax=Phasianus colchicus TaxID=9054 RepID=UPI00129DA9DB|nr:5-oxoprolinase [Phasianus colchicus]